MTVRYVIRYRDDATTPHNWCPVSRKYLTHKPHPHRGHYIMDGGHTTADFQDAKVFRGTAATGRAYRESIHELVPVKLVKVRT